jgi:hypothetical protein
MHKTFTDCYFAKGFKGGGWGYSLNSNNADGVLLEGEEEDGERPLQGEERRLAYYYLGWESVEVRTISPVIDNS